MQERNVEECWDKMEGPLSEMYRKGGDDPTKIYRSIRDGESRLLFGEDGFIILSVEIEQEEKILYVWVSHSFKDGAHEMFKKYEPLLVDAAKQNGLTKIQFMTHRHGFARMLSNEWKMVHTLWEKDIV